MITNIATNPLSLCEPCILRGTSLQIHVFLTQLAADKIEILYSFGFSEELRAKRR